LRQGQDVVPSLRRIDHAALDRQGDPGPDISNEDLQDRREPAIELDEEPAIAVRQLDPAPYLASQDDQLMSQRRILHLKPPLRLEWRGQRGKNEEDQRDHRANLADSVA
jgi:hypothetical protein